VLECVDRVEGLRITMALRRIIILIEYLGHSECGLNNYAKVNVNNWKQQFTNRIPVGNAGN